jgi:HK97 family phage major capsid protein
MEKLQTLKESRATLASEMEGLVNAETRSEIQIARMNELNTQIEKLTSEIEVLERSFKNSQFKPVAKNDGLTAEQREIAKSFSFQKVMSAIESRTSLSGFEAEMHDEAKAEARSFGGVVKGIGVPMKALDAMVQKRAMTAGTNNAGGYGVQTNVTSYIQYLWNKTFMSQLGIAPMTGLTGNYSAPKEGAVTGAWLTETGAASDETPTLDQLLLSPKRLAVFIKVSKTLAIQSPDVADAMVMDMLMNAQATLLEKAVAKGGGSNEPTGIISTSGIGNVAMGTNGAAPTYAKIVDLIKTVSAANAVGNGFLTTPTIAAKLLVTEQFTGTNGVPVNQNNTIAGYKLVASNNAPSGLTKGSSSDCHAIIFGDFSKVKVAQWGGLDLVIDPFSLAESNLNKVIVNAYYDIGLEQASAFAAIKDARDV